MFLPILTLTTVRAAVLTEAPRTVSAQLQVTAAAAVGCPVAKRLVTAEVPAQRGRPWTRSQVPRTADAAPTARLAPCPLGLFLKAVWVGMACGLTFRPSLLPLRIVMHVFACQELFEVSWDIVL
jgi:hypothetical protein